MHRLTRSLSLPTLCYVAIQKSSLIDLAVRNNQERVVTVKYENDSEIIVESEGQERVVTVICVNYSKIVALEQLSALSGYTSRQTAVTSPHLRLPHLQISSYGPVFQYMYTCTVP